MANSGATMMVEYSGETWTASHSPPVDAKVLRFRCVKPPIIFGDVRRSTL
jgi:hypothetical protein